MILPNKQMDLPISTSLLRRSTILEILQGPMVHFQLSQSTFANFAQLLSHASQSGSDTVIQTDATNTITLKDVALSTLDQNHFSFV